MSFRDREREVEIESEREIEERKTERVISRHRILAVSLERDVRIHSVCAKRG